MATLPPDLPRTLRASEAHDHIELALPLGLESIRRKLFVVAIGPSAALAMVLLLVAGALGGMPDWLWASAVCLTWSALPPAALVALGSRAQPTYFWPVLLRRHMPVLRISAHTLTVRDGRGEQGIPLESIRGIREHAGSLIADRKTGHVIIATSLRADESAYLTAWIGGYAAQVREAMLRDGHEVDRAAIPPAALHQLRDQHEG